MAEVYSHERTDFPSGELSMKKNNLYKFVFLTACSVLFVFTCEVSSAFWLWSPKGNKLENPKYAPKDTPDEQYEWAMRFFQDKDFKRAAEEFVRLTAHYKDSDIAPEAQYYAGRSYEELGKYWFAYQNYQKTVDNYPYTRRMDEILHREYNIANIFESKEEPRLMDIELNLSLEKATIIYKDIVKNSAFGEYADKSLFRMADCYRRMKKYNEAIDAYNTLINDYPTSSLASDARYQLAYTTYEASLDPEYDQESTDEALRKFQEIAKTTAVPQLATEADKALSILRNRKAGSIMKIAMFYERTGKPKSAIIYYQDIVNNFPETESAPLAKERIDVLEDKLSKKGKDIGSLFNFF